MTPEHDHPSMTTDDDCTVMAPEPEPEQESGAPGDGRMSRKAAAALALTYLAGGLYLGVRIGKTSPVVVARPVAEEIPVRQWQIGNLDERIRRLEADQHAHAEFHRGRDHEGVSHGSTST